MAAPSATNLAKLPFFEPVCTGLRAGADKDLLAHMFGTDLLVIATIEAEFVLNDGKAAASAAAPPCTTPKPGVSYTLWQLPLLPMTPTLA